MKRTNKRRHERKLSLEMQLATLVWGDAAVVSVDTVPACGWFYDTAREPGTTWVLLEGVGFRQVKPELKRVKVPVCCAETVKEHLWELLLDRWRVGRKYATRVVVCRDGDDFGVLMWTEVGDLCK